MDPENIPNRFAKSISKGFLMPFQALAVGIALILIIGILHLLMVPTYAIPFILIAALSIWIFMYKNERKKHQITEHSEQNQLQTQTRTNTLGISKRRFMKLLDLKDLKPVRYRKSIYGKNKIPFDSPLPDDNCALLARKTIAVDQLYITGIDSSGNITEVFYSQFSKKKLHELQEKLRLLETNKSENK